MAIAMQNNMTTKSLSLNFPAEVVIEILSWLPIKSLSRFRCVSKPWLYLITKDPYFNKLYQDRSSKITSILFLKHSYTTPAERIKIYSAIDISTCEDDEAIELDSSYLPSGDKYINSISNGLVCLVGNERAEYEYDPCNWNPLTKDYVLIPNSWCSSSSCHQDCENITNAGFGYDQDTNQCTLITFCLLNEILTESGYMSHVSLYTLGKDSAWRTLQNVPYYVCHGGFNAPLVSGALHWFATAKTPILFNGESATYQQTNYILSFIMKDEIFKMIPPPNDVRLDEYDMEVGELGGLLCVFNMPKGENVQIWVMEEYGEGNSWTKKFIIGQPDFCPLGVTHEEEILLQNHKNTKKLILYNPKTSSVRNIEFGFELYYAFIFTRSTLSPTLIRGAKDNMT